MSASERITVAPALKDLTQSLNPLAQLIYENNKAKGFWEGERNVGELLMLVVSELGEAIEAHRKSMFTQLSAEEKASIDTEFSKTYFQERIKNNFEDEIADAMIRLLDLSAGLGIDIGWHIQQKVAYNTSRAYKHGKSY